MPSVQKSHANNMQAAEGADFVERVVGELRRHPDTSVRVHVSGDFYNATYTRKWIEIAKQCPQLTFYAYTRSWRLKPMLESLLELADLPNVHMWWSIDNETDQIDGTPPAHPGIRVAYMQVEHGEPIPTYTDLVFRVKRDTVERFIDGRLVCAAENGMKYPKKMTCSQCKLCLTARAIPHKPKPPVRVLQAESADHAH